VLPSNHGEPKSVPTQLKTKTPGWTHMLLPTSVGRFSVFFFWQNYWVQLLEDCLDSFETKIIFKENQAWFQNFEEKKFQLVFKVLVLRHFITIDFQKPFLQILIKSSTILNKFFLCATTQSIQKIRKSVLLEKAIHKFLLESAPASMLRSWSLTIKLI
jgi:hypothetical protein